MEKVLQIENKLIGNDSVFVIAEAGVNHNGSLVLAKKLVDVAKEAGADVVKFQTFKSEELITEEADMASYQEKNTGKKESQLDMLKKLELSYKDFEELKKYCDQKKIIFLSTPHTEGAVDFLDKLVPAFKVSSGDLTNLPFLENIAKRNKSIILSTGMGTLGEIREAVETIKKYNDQIIILHCITNYPCTKEDVNLRAMETIQKEFGCITGYSDHTEGIEVPIMAVNLGAKVIEKHFTLDKNMEGPDHKASLNPAELKLMIDKIRKNEKIETPEEILGNGLKIPNKNETEIAKVARKSVVAKINIPLNSVITEDMLVIKRPGTGINPKDISKVIGKRTSKEIKQDNLVEWNDLI